MSNTGKILVAFLIAIVITAIILAVRYQQKIKAIANTMTGGAQPNTTTTGGTSANTGGIVSGVPTYEIGWDGFKPGVALENIAGGTEFVMNAIVRMIAVKDIDSLNNWITTDAKGPAAPKAPIMFGGGANGTSSSVNVVIKGGYFGKINFIDSSKMQITVSPAVYSPGVFYNRGTAVPAGNYINNTGSQIQLFITMTRTQFNENFAGKIGFLKS